MCVRDIEFTYFYDFSFGCWNCSNSIGPPSPKFKWSTHYSCIGWKINEIISGKEMNYIFLIKLMKRNDFILSLKQDFNMKHTLEPISVSRCPLSPVQAEFLDSSRYYGTRMQCLLGICCKWKLAVIRHLKLLQHNLCHC